jgi:methyl-accepting chemotaxis protein
MFLFNNNTSKKVCSTTTSPIQGGNMKFSDMKVSNRLIAGFGTTLLLLLAVAVASWLSIRQTAADTDTLLAHHLQTERLVSEWKSIVQTNVQRAVAASKTSDPATQKMFEDGIATASRQAEENQRQIIELLDDAGAKTLFAQALEKRKAYQAIRKRAFAEKADGDLEKTRQIIDSEFIPAGEAYVAAMGALVARQKAVIDEIGDGIHRRSAGSALTILVLSLSSVALAVTLGWLIARSLLKQLGGEPGYAAGITDRIAAGDLTVHVQLEASDRSSLLFSIAAMRDKLASIVSEVRISTDSVATASNEIASGNLDLSTRTEQQAGSLEETASSMEELTATVKQNTDYARQANQLAASAASVAVRGGGVVAEVVTTMESISASSKRIVDIIGVIDGIAFQTNILALNAAVEAARAGEQGRGFAVVASEVRNLAQRSASAAKDIKQLIGDSVDRIEDGAKLVDQAGSTMSEIVASVQRVSDIMAQITTASNEQEAGIEQINQAIVEMDGVTQQNAALVEEAAAAAASLQGQSSHLAELVSVFKLESKTASVRAISGARRAASVPTQPVHARSEPAPRRLTGTR